MPAREYRYQIGRRISAPYKTYSAAKSAGKQAGNRRGKDAIIVVREGGQSRYAGYANPPDPDGPGELEEFIAASMDNPAPAKRVKIYSRIESIHASKAGMPHRCDPACKRAGHRYVHKFSTRACIWGLPDGTLLIGG